MNLASSTAQSPAGRKIFGLSPWLLVGVSLVLGLAMLVLAVWNSERERRHITQNYLDRAEALIWALEAGARAEKGLDGRFLLQALIEETSRQPGIKFMAIVDRSGSILAHSDPAQVGKALSIKQLPAVLPANVIEYAGQKKNDDGLFEVYRGFSPLSQEHEPRDEHAKGQPESHDSHLGPHTTLEQGSEPDVLNKEEATSFIFVGFDKKPFDEALATDFVNSLFTTLVVAALGFAGFVSVFWAHSHRDSRRKLKDTQALAAEVVTSLPLGLITSDPAGILGMSNSTALAMFQANKKSVEGKLVREIPGLDWDSIIASLSRDKKVLEREMSLATPDGKHLPISVSASEIRGYDGLFLGHLFIFHDITEIKRLQMEAQKNERLSALGNLAAGVAHEIRNPLSSIKGLATYIAGKVQSDAPVEEAANTMILEVNRLNRVVSELLEFARPSVVKVAKTDIDAVVTRALRLSNADLQAGQVRVDYVPNPNFPLVLANGERLTQALLNLFLNAVQAMDPGGELRVRIEERSQSEFAIVVSDTGKGIPPEALVSIFTPYFTTKPSGTGLGLAIVHQIIEGHGGKISVASEPDKGTTFTLLLPLRAQEA